MVILRFSSLIVTKWSNSSFKSILQSIDLPALPRCSKTLSLPLEIPAWSCKVTCPQVTMNEIHQMAIILGTTGTFKSFV